MPRPIRENARIAYLSQPLPRQTISAILDLAAWAVAVLLDLALVAKLLQFGLRDVPSRGELRLPTTCSRFERSSITTSSSVWTIRSRTESSPRSRFWHAARATMSAFWTSELHKRLHT